MQHVSFGPPSTPPVIRRLIWTLCSFSLVSALLEPWLHLQALLSLSLPGIASGSLWQLITHPLVVQPSGSLSFGFFLSLFFSCYLLWFLGTHLAERFGEKAFLSLLLTATLTSATGALLAAYCTGQFSLIFGTEALLFAIMIPWVMLNPDAQFLIFLTLPALARWIVFGSLGISLLINLSQGDSVGIAHLLSGATTGYLTGLLRWNLRSPFPQMEPFDQWILSWKPPLNRSSTSSKIVDFRTGKPVVRDDEFMDAMLDKISQKGSNSLSWRERWKMKRISKKRRPPGGPSSLS